MATVTNVLSTLFRSDVMYGKVKSHMRHGDGMSKELLDYIGNFNGWELTADISKKLADAIRSLAKRGLIESIEFGREYSPVLYVEVCHWNEKRGELLTQKGLEKRANLVYDYLKQIEADERHLTPPLRGAERMERMGSVRLWWD